eukprot:scaffold13213_cov117-Skeletonema_dohrnii-CCMP3373.AAC.1
MRPVSMQGLQGRADTLSHYCDRGRLFITLGTSPVLPLIISALLHHDRSCFSQRCFTKSDDLMHIKSYAQIVADHWMSGRHLICPFHDQVLLQPPKPSLNQVSTTLNQA